MLTQNITNGWEYSFTASSTASIPVLVPANLHGVLVTYYNLTIVAGAGVVIQLSTNSGASYINSGYQSGLPDFFWNAPSPGTQSQSAGLACSFSNYGANNTHSGFIYLLGLNSSSQTSSNGVFNAPLGGGTYGALTFGTLQGTTNVNAFQVIALGSTITTGTFNFYGLN